MPAAHWIFQATLWDGVAKVMALKRVPAVVTGVMNKANEAVFSVFCKSVCPKIKEKKMKKYIKPQMRVYITASRLLEGSRATLTVDPTEEGYGDVL